MRLHVVDPPAYTPPYDHALCAALARAGADVTLVTSPFDYGDFTEIGGYATEELFYAHTPGRLKGRWRQAARLLQHVPDMARYAHRSRAADVVHFQWLSVQQIDVRMLPRHRPLVLTAHDILPREPRPGQRRAQRRLYDRVDAIVVHSRAGHRRLTADLGVPSDRVHVIPHGAFTHLRDLPDRAPLPPELAAVDRPVVLLFGLQRPYKGLDVAVEAWRGITDAELWIVGMPRMDLRALKATAPVGVRFVDRFVPDREVAAYFERADLVVLPYRVADQSGVLFTALAFGKPLLLSEVGGFPEIAAAGAARLVPPGDAVALHSELVTLLGDAPARQRLADAAVRAAHEQYGWDGIAHAHLALYEALMR